MEASTSSTIEPESMYGYINNLLMNPTALIILVIIVLIYLIVFVSLGDSSNTTSSFSTNGSSGLDKMSGTIIAIIAGIFVILLLFNVLQYFFSIDIMASIKNLFNPTNPQLDITVNENTGKGADSSEPIPEISTIQQVFNIPGNYYGYEDAKTLCQAYGSRLATYNEVEDSYNKGGEWCNYGWSDGQMALFPTQKTTFDNLQKIPGHEHDCGRPGVNGGYMANPHIQYGVNCFGYKPKITSEEEEMMQNTTPYPKTEKDILFEKRVDFWKTKLNDILVSPFNYNSWSRV
uniref:Link domain-containing protein n=1 Tax=viral metagenome TaxID=1070528 RepID=A0A6C0K3P9_9ZZZZ